MKVELYPFPHLVVPALLSDMDFRRVLDLWPVRRTMWHQTSHDRFYLNLLDQKQVAAIDSGWSAITANVLVPALRALAARFYPFYAPRFSGKPQLTAYAISLHEAGGDFVEHCPHSHFEHSPEYAFTLIYQVADRGRVDRGTTLYATREATSPEMLMDVCAGIYAHETKPAVMVPFRPNQALSFVDSARSFHGSTPFKKRWWRGRRKMIVCHVAATAAYAAMPCRVPDEAFFNSQFAARRGREAVDPRVQAICEREFDVVRSWNTAPSSEPPNIEFDISY